MNNIISDQGKLVDWYQIHADKVSESVRSLIDWCQENEDTVSEATYSFSYEVMDEFKLIDVNIKVTSKDDTNFKIIDADGHHRGYDFDDVGIPAVMDKASKIAIKQIWDTRKRVIQLKRDMYLLKLLDPDKPTKKEKKRSKGERGYLINANTRSHTQK